MLFNLEGSETGESPVSDQITEKRKCIKCRNVRPLTDFHKNGRGKRATQCKDCFNAYKRETYDPEYDRRKRFRKKFGISIEDYNVLFHAQGGVCAACGNEEVAFDIDNNCFLKLAVDHDHKTGKVRGLLCRGCNIAYGYLYEDPQRIQGLLDYCNRIQKEGDK